MKSALRRPFVIGALTALACALPAVVLNRWEVSLDEGMRLVPALLHARNAALVLPLVPFVVAGWAARRAWSALRTLSRGRQIGWVLALLVAQVALAVVSVVAHVESQKNWLFGTPLPITSMRSPNGARTAYVTQDCFLFCHVDVHVREGMSPVMRRVLRYDNVKAERARIAWHGDTPADIEVIDLTPTPAFTGIFSGPH